MVDVAATAAIDLVDTWTWASLSSEVATVGLFAAAVVVVVTSALVGGA